MYYLSIKAGLTKLQAGFAKKEAELRESGREAPTIIEQIMGVLCALCMIANLYFKWESMTLIFLFNPCHVVCVSQSKP